VPIGRPISNARLYVLDPLLQLAPIGAPGQLYISGPCLAAGYLHRPDLTAGVFLPNPFAEAPGSNTSCMYSTGDLVRWLPGEASGALEFLGRVDHQVKLRGFRIELQVGCDDEGYRRGEAGVGCTSSAVHPESITNLTARTLKIRGGLRPLG
jgi:non-ribosomal peptide synthetase component F